MPALAVADALRARGAEVSFAGGERAEAELVPAAGYRFERLRVAGLDRRNPLKAARAAGMAATAVLRARKLLRREGADVAIGGGGYVAGPVGLAAVSLRIPLLLTEADSQLGVANRLLAPFAGRVCLAFPLDGRDGPRYLVTGRPVPPGERCLLVFGGSLGARSLNEAAIEAFATNPPCAVLHATGRRDYEGLRRRLTELGGGAGRYFLHPYIEPFADAYAAADLVAARAGGSVFELAAAGLPALLVPYPHATADHQAKNARWMEEGGAALVIPDAELNPERLRNEVSALLEDPDRLERMSRAASALARPDAADRIAGEALALVRRVSV